MKTLKNKAKKGFTIVELVIVIAVIAILAAVLIPTFSGVINAANESVMMQECRAEWSNYLPEVAAETGFGNATYYVAYDEDYKEGSVYSADYYYKVSKASFDADTVYDVTEEALPTTGFIAINYTYEYLNEHIKIYVPYSTTGTYSAGDTSEVGENEKVAANAADALATVASTNNNSFASGTTYYTKVINTSSDVTYYFKAMLKSSGTVTAQADWIVLRSTASVYSTVSTDSSTNSSKYTKITISTQTTGYTVSAYTASTN